MWAEELGIDNIPDNHPDISKFCSSWPYDAELTTWLSATGKLSVRKKVAEYRKHTEQTRLTNAQLVLGL